MHAEYTTFAHTRVPLPDFIRNRLFLVVIMYFIYAFWLLIGMQSKAKTWKRLEALVRNPKGENEVVAKYVTNVLRRVVCEML